MLNKLIPLADIHLAARSVERDARKRIGNRAAALELAQYEIVVAPGCHSRPSFDPPRIGWVVSKAAAEALSARLTEMPDGTSHRRTAYVHHPA